MKTDFYANSCEAFRAAAKVAKKGDEFWDDEFRWGELDQFLDASHRYYIIIKFGSCRFVAYDENGCRPNPKTGVNERHLWYMQFTKHSNTPEKKELPPMDLADIKDVLESAATDSDNAFNDAIEALERAEEELAHLQAENKALAEELAKAKTCVYDAQIVKENEELTAKVKNLTEDLANARESMKYWNNARNKAEQDVQSLRRALEASNDSLIKLQKQLTPTSCCSYIYCGAALWLGSCGYVHIRGIKPNVCPHCKRNTL